MRTKVITFDLKVSEEAAKLVEALSKKYPRQQKLDNFPLFCTLLAPSLIATAYDLRYALISLLVILLVAYLEK